MLILVLFLSVLSKVTTGERFCDESPFITCPHPKLFTTIPTSVTVYNDLCPELKYYIQCLGKYQVKCGGTFEFFKSDEEYESLVSAFSEFCEEGALLNIIATENLKCLNESFSANHCPEEMDTFLTVFQNSFLDDPEIIIDFPHTWKNCLEETFLLLVLLKRYLKIVAIL
ncbi:uncharacterized protein CEXT_508691 [Caerostris extrusa]|uniref:Uncharacterized protein n=1 Tax=Caerostris extrusa TaxID=172846 RepID=A0AAV4T655_CAEEX|nr:uncharacterized protein CEXT_508691 [Caerostris extrusa]